MTLLEDGGVLVVVGTRTTNVSDEWRSHPRVQLWDSTDPDTRRRELPSNARAVIYTRWVSHDLTNRLIKTARDRGNVTLFPISSTHALNDKIAELFGMKPLTTAPTTAKKGALKQLVIEHADFTVSPKVEAQRLFALAREKGIATTPTSVAECLGRVRREQRRTDAPDSVTLTRPTGTGHVLAVLDDAIAGLQLIRETVEKMDTENKTLAAKLANLRKAME